MARSTSGEVAGLSSQLGRVRIPHESLTWACRRVGALTCNQGYWVRFPARPLKYDSGRGADGSTPALGAGGFRFDPEVPDLTGWRNEA